MDTLPEMLLARRAVLGHTQESAADAMSASRRIVGAWERGDAFPGPFSLSGVATYLGVEVIEVVRLKRKFND